MVVDDKLVRREVKSTTSKISRVSIPVLWAGEAPGPSQSVPSSRLDIGSACRR